MGKDKDDIIENAPIMPIYVTGVGTVHVRHGTVYIGLTADQCRINKPGVERVLVARIVMPVTLVETLHTEVMRAINSVIGN